MCFVGNVIAGWITFVFLQWALHLLAAVEAQRVSGDILNPTKDSALPPGVNLWSESATKALRLVKDHGLDWL